MVSLDLVFLDPGPFFMSWKPLCHGSLYVIGKYEHFCSFQFHATVVLPDKVNTKIYKLVQPSTFIPSIVLQSDWPITHPLLHKHSIHHGMLLIQP